MKAKSFMRQLLSVGAFAGEYQNPLTAAAVFCTEKSSNLHRVDRISVVKKVWQKGRALYYWIAGFSGMAPKYIISNFPRAQRKNKHISCLPLRGEGGARSASDEVLKHIDWCKCYVIATSPSPVAAFLSPIREEEISYS